MKLNINFRNMHSRGDIIDHIDHRLSFAFSCTRDDIESAMITISDINGPKGGIDKECKVVVKPAGLGKIVISETRDNVRQAIDRCLARASQSVNRKLKRRQALFKKTRENLDDLTEANQMVSNFY